MSGSTDKNPGAPRWLDAPGGRSAKRPPLNRRRIVEAAVAVIDEHGLAAFTVRRVAARLGVSPMSLYSHVADKAELIDLLVDWVVGESRIEPDPELDWIGKLRAIFLRARDSWTAHPGVLQAYATAAANPRPMATGPNALAMAETVAAVLADAGFSPEGQAQAFMALHSFLRGALLSQPNRMQMIEADDAAEGSDPMRTFLGGVAPEAVPHFVAIALHLQPSGNFEYALDVFLAGLEAKLDAGG